MNAKNFVDENFYRSDFYDMVDYGLDFDNYEHSWFNSKKSDHDAIMKAVVFVNNLNKEKLTNDEIEEVIEYILKDMKRYAHDNPDTMNGYRTTVPKLNIRKMF